MRRSGTQIVFELNMRTLIAILTGLHVLAHGIFGCCNHGQVATNARTPGCACHHAEHVDHGDHANGHAKPAGNCLATDEESPASAPHRCVHASCHWLAADADASQLTSDFNSFVALDVTAASPASALTAAEFWPDADSSQFSAPPLRLHLALGVLLI